MGCKETLPVGRAGREGKPGDERDQGVSPCLTLSPFSSRNMDPASLAPAVGLVVAGVHQPPQPVGGPGEEAL